MSQPSRTSSLCSLGESLCLCGKYFHRYSHHRDTEGHKVSRRNKPPLLLSIFLLSHLVLAPVSNAQRQPSRNGAHSTTTREPFSSADRRIVERAIGATCAERMLPATRKLVVNAIIQLAKDYDLYGSAAMQTKINSATTRVEAVRRVKPDVDARDNASVVLRDPRTIEFGTIFLAGLRSDEAMIGVLAHELTHIASGQPDSLKPLFRAIGRRAATRTGLRIQGQRAEELACDLVGALAVREYIKETPSWDPLPRRLARAFEHNCVDDDASDEDHLSPRNTIPALFALEVGLANEILGDVTLSALWLRLNLDLVRDESVGKSAL